MSDREPALLGDPSRDESRDKDERSAPYGAASHVEGNDSSGGAGSGAAAAVARSPVPEVEPSAPRPRRDAGAVFVVGFWRRLVAAAIDLAVVMPPALLIALICSRITGLHVPSNIRLLDIDLWIDLVLATDPALVMALVLICAIGMIYLLVFQVAVGRTLGMRVMGMKIIDVYGDRPSAVRCLARCGGYLAGVATLFLGFLWMGFDSEKRGVQDWIAGTYVIKA